MLWTDATTTQKALDRARTFYSQERRNATPAPVAVTLWGYSEKSSGGQQTIGALKSYGLMEDDGRGETRRVRLSDLALAILLDDRPGSAERTAALKTAATKPKIMAEIVEKWPEHPPADATLRYFLLKDKSFSDEAAGDVLEIFNQNKDFARLYTSDTLSSSSPLAPDSSRETSRLMTVGITVPVVRTGAEMHAATLVVEKVIGPDGDIILQFHGDPTRESYEFLMEYIQLRLKALSRRLERSTGGGSSDAGNAA